MKTKKRYLELVKSASDNQEQRPNNQRPEKITQEDIQKLPQPIQKYLNYVGVVGTEKVVNFKAQIEGTLTLKPKAEPLPYIGEQSNFILQGIRLFYMDVSMKKIKLYGLHHFDQEDARMQIKVFDLFQVVNENGQHMREAETVTFFNDMVLFAPQTLISDQIQWKELDDFYVEATFTHNNICIKAILIFDALGRIIDFTSDDRWVREKGGVMKQVPWSTPISKYQTINGLHLPAYGEAVWHYPEGKFSYITLFIKNIIYNF